MSHRKGIVLAGGSGTRLAPITSVVSKQLLPIYDKPMIYYPISVLMLANIRDILIISSPKDLKNFEILLGDGTNFGVNFSYLVQEEPKGIAEAFIIGENFINNNNSALILGDNLFYGQNFSSNLIKASLNNNGATIFGYKVLNANSYGVIEVDENLNPVSIEEKPANPKSNIAITGLYFYDNNVVDVAKSLKPSSRNEIEITDINSYYLEKKNLNLSILGRGFTWLDSGTPESLLEASNYVQTIEKNQGYKIACLEEIALNKKWITLVDIEKNISNLKQNSYIDYLKYLLETNPKKEQ